MRYDDDAYREVFPKQEKIVEPIIETPIETFQPSREVAAEVTPEPEVIQEPVTETINNDVTA